MLEKSMFSLLFRLYARKILYSCWENTRLAPEFHQSRLQCYQYAYLYENYKTGTRECVCYNRAVHYGMAGQNGAHFWQLINLKRIKRDTNQGHSWCRNTRDSPMTPGLVGSRNVQDTWCCWCRIWYGNSGVECAHWRMICFPPLLQPLRGKVHVYLHKRCYTSV